MDASKHTAVCSFVSNHRVAKGKPIVVIIDINFAHEKWSIRFIYKIPDGYIYELPEIFSSASLAAVTGNGNPQRQGILHRELLYQHAVVFYNNYLYALSEETYNSSGIPEVMFRNARCEVLVPGKNGKRMQKINLNNILRRMSVQRELDAVHPCFQNDFYIKELIAPPFVYYAIVPKCFHCNNTERLFYCSLCRKRHVQTPHVYCSKVCVVNDIVLYVSAFIFFKSLA